jgi:hypothetical protein
VIERPQDEVARYAGDPSNAPGWYVNIKSVEWKTPPPLQLGSKVAFVARFLGRRLAYTAAPQCAFATADSRAAFLSSPRR